MFRVILATITFLIIIISVSTAQESQKAVFGIKSGINLSSFSASVNSESRAKVGLALGVYLKKQIGPKLFFRPELYYSNQGQKDNHLYPYGGPSIGSTVTNLHYLNIPCLFELGNKISLQFGGQIGVLIAGTEKGTVASVDIDEKVTKVMTTADFALVVGAGYSFNRRINTGVRINYGITNIYNPEVESGFPVELPNVQNRVFHFYVGYSF